MNADNKLDEFINLLDDLYDEDKPVLVTNKELLKDMVWVLTGLKSGERRKWIKRFAQDSFIGEDFNKELDKMILNKGG